MASCYTSALKASAVILLTVLALWLFRLHSARKHTQPQGDVPIVATLPGHQSNAAKAPFPVDQGGQDSSTTTDSPSAQWGDVKETLLHSYPELRELILWHSSSDAAHEQRVGTYRYIQQQVAKGKFPLEQINLLRSYCYYQGLLQLMQSDEEFSEVALADLVDTWAQSYLQAKSEPGEMMNLLDGVPVSRKELQVFLADPTHYVARLNDRLLAISSISEEVPLVMHYYLDSARESIIASATGHYLEKLMSADQIEVRTTFFESRLENYRKLREKGTL